MTAASATAGCVNRRSSTSLAEMFSMLRMMMSFTRPVMRDVAVGVEPSEVAGPEVAVVVEGVGVERRVEVAPHDHRTLDPDLALVPDAGPLAVELHGDEVDAARRPGPRCSASTSSLSRTDAIVTIGASVMP